MNDWDFWFAAGAEAVDDNWIDTDRLLDAGRIERWGHRAHIHHRDDVDELYVVIRGGVEVDGDSSARLKNGDLFGLIDPDSDPRFRAFDETTIVAIPRSEFEQLVDRNGLIRSTRVRERLRAVDLSVELAFDDIIGVRPVSRMIRAFASLARNLEPDAERVALPNLKPRHYSTLAALDRESARYAFRQMHDRSLLETSSGSLVIPSVPELILQIEKAS